MKKPSDAAQAILDGISARAAAHKARPVEVRPEPKACRFCGHVYLEPCDDGAVAGVVGIEVGVVSGVLSPDESGGDTPDLWRPRHAKRYHEA